jgi:lactate/malate dehydrogenase, NAD binding domain
MKIGIVGAGQVGATAAYSMMMRRVGSEIMLVDRNADLAAAQARDILDAVIHAERGSRTRPALPWVPPLSRLKTSSPSLSRSAPDDFYHHRRSDRGCSRPNLLCVLIIVRSRNATKIGV